jgi:hypothetical protein
MGNLTIKDALQHKAVAGAYARAVAAVNTVRHSRLLLEELAEHTNGATPPRVVVVRWRTAIPVIDFVVKHQASLEALGGEASVSIEDAKLLGVVRGVLEPLDILLAYAQSDVGGDAFFLFSRACKAIGDVVKELGRVVMPNTNAFSALSRALVMDVHLEDWWEFVKNRASRRFFSHKTTYFKDADEPGACDYFEADEFPAPEGASESDSELDTVEDPKEDATEDPDEDSDKGRYRRFNYTTPTAVQAAFGCSPFKSAYQLGVAHKAFKDCITDDDVLRNGAHAVLAIRYMIDWEWRSEVDKPGAIASDEAAGQDPMALMLVAFAGTKGTADPIHAALKVVTNFQQKQELMELFKTAPQMVTHHDPDSERSFMRSWVDLADREARWLGRVLRLVLSAPLRSTKCESDFSLFQHVLAPRRNRLSRTLLAAFMLVKKNPDLADVEEAQRDPAIKVRVTGPMDVFTAKARAVTAASVSGFACSAASAAVAGATAAPVAADVVEVEQEPEDEVIIAYAEGSVQPHAPPAAAVAAPVRVQRARRRRADSDDDDDDDDDDDGSHEEPDMVWHRVKTRTGRVVKVARAAVIAQRILPDAGRLGGQ